MRTMKRLITAAAALAVVAATVAPGLAKELRILAWQGYADPDWVKAFEAEYKVDVNAAQLQRYLDLGLVAPYDLAKVPNQKETLPRFQDLTKVSGVMRDGKV